MRTKKPTGNHKHHPHNECGTCAKPRMDRIKKKEHDERFKRLEEEFARWCECKEVDITDSEDC